MVLTVCGRRVNVCIYHFYLTLKIIMGMELRRPRSFVVIYISRRQRWWLISHVECVRMIISGPQTFAHDTCSHFIELDIRVMMNCIYSNVLCYIPRLHSCTYTCIYIYTLYTYASILLLLTWNQNLNYFSFILPFVN